MGAVTLYAVTMREIAMLTVCGMCPSVTIERDTGYHSMIPNPCVRSISRWLAYPAMIASQMVSCGSAA